MTTPDPTSGPDSQTAQATAAPAVAKTDDPTTLMVLVDDDPGGDYDHWKTFLVLTFAQRLDDTTRDRLIARLRQTPQGYLPDTEYHGEPGDISYVVTMRNVVAACTDEGAQVQTVQMVNGYNYIGCDTDRLDLSATPDEVNRRSDHGTYTVTGPSADSTAIADHQSGETFDDIRAALADPDDVVDAVFDLIVAERGDYWAERLASTLPRVRAAITEQEGARVADTVMGIIADEFGVNL